MKARADLCDDYGRMTGNLYVCELMLVYADIGACNCNIWEQDTLRDNQADTSDKLRTVALRRTIHGTKITS